MKVAFALLVCMFAATSVASATCTATRTVYKTVIGETSTTSSTYPSTTVRVYSSTVLVGTPFHGPKPFTYSNPPNPVNCAYYTGSHIPSAALSDGIQARDPAPNRCTTTKTTKTTVTVEYLCIETDLQYPPPVLVSKHGVLTTRVPDFCTTPPKRTTGQVPPGDLVYPLSYPYFAQTPVECCIYCSKQYYNVVASALIPEVLDCQCLVNNATDYPGKSKSCPRGIQPYAFDKDEGQALPGPCFKEQVVASG